jgi:MYXO-CTERM domain-containing protein
VVTVSAGVVTIEGFITRGGLVPDQAVTSVRLVNESLIDLSSPMAVPEPRAALLGGLGLLGLLRRRR